MSSPGTTPQRSAQRKASAMFNKSQERQLESDRRVVEQRIAERQFAAKTERLRALRLQRDALMASEEAERKALEPKPAPRKKKAASPT
jgi:hypothetical protein